MCGTVQSHTQPHHVDTGNTVHQSTAHSTNQQLSVGARGQAGVCQSHPSHCRAHTHSLQECRTTGTLRCHSRRQLESAVSCWQG